MATVIDSLIITLGLDPSDFTKGQKEVAASFVKTKEEAVKSGKAVEKSSEDMSDALSKASRSVLTLMSAFLGGRGVKDFIDDAKTANTGLGNLSMGLGSSAQMISAWGMAAQRMGGSAASTQASIQALSDSLVDFRTQGKALPDALFQLEAKSGKNIDFQNGWQKYMADLATAANQLAKTDPAAANRFLRSIGVDPETANLMIQQGPRMKDYLETMKHLAPTDKDVSAAQQMTLSTSKLGQEFSQLATKVGTAIAPALVWLSDKIGGVVEAMSKWVEKNPGWTEAIVGFLGLLSAGGIIVAIKNVLALRKALVGLAEANAASSSVGLLGLLTRLGIVGAVAGGLYDTYEHSTLNAGEDEIARQKKYGKGGGLSGNDAIRSRGSGARVNKLAQNENAKAAIDELRKAGYNDNAIAAIVGSMQTESSFNPRAHNGVGGGHTGAWQWDSTRWPKIAAWIKSQGGDPADFRWQTKAWIAEHNAKPGDAIYDIPKTQAGGAILRNSPSLGAAIHGVQLSERFGVGEEGGRAANAANWLPHVALKPRLWSGAPGAGALPGARAGAAHAAALHNISNDHRVTTTSSSNEMHINGGVHVNAPQATDAHGIAKEIDRALASNAFATYANYGVS